MQVRELIELLRAHPEWAGLTVNVAGPNDLVELEGSDLEREGNALNFITSRYPEVCR